MKLIIYWLLDLLSNFRLHIAVLSLIGILLFAVVIDSALIAALFSIPFLFASLPVNSWWKCDNRAKNNFDEAYEVGSFNIEWNASEHTQSLEYIKNSQANILVLQEVTEPLKENISQYSEMFPYQLGEGHSHVMVLSKNELELIEYLPWPGKFQQRAMHVVCKLNSKPLHILAIHLQVTRSWREVALRNQQIDTLIEKLNEIKQPVLVVGDFNAGTGSNVLRQFENRSSMCSHENLFNYKRTWPSRAGILGLQLDHFYCDTQIIMSEPMIGPVLDSDHRPISMRFIFN